MSQPFFSMGTISAHGASRQPLGEMVATFPFPSRSPLSTFTGREAIPQPSSWFLPSATLDDRKHRRSCIRLYI
jgi:hypothetical protein